MTAPEFNVVDYIDLVDRMTELLNAETERLETLVRHARRKGVKAAHRPEWSRAK